MIDYFTEQKMVTNENTKDLQGLIAQSNTEVKMNVLLKSGGREGPKLSGGFGYHPCLPETLSKDE